MAEVDLKKLVKRRAVIKSQLTRFNTYLQAVSDADELEPNTISELEIRIHNIESLLESFNDIQLDIELCHGDDEDLNATRERETFETLYFSLISRARQFIVNNSKTIDQQSNLDEASQVSRDKSHNVRLPKMNIPSFTGSYESWYEFKGMFESLIHNNEQLGEIEKFYYLKSSLKGDAAQVIQSIEVSASNYQLAWDLLHNRYDNKRLIIHNHVAALFDIPSMAKESHVKLRQLLDSVLKHLRSLQTIGQPTEYWDTLIIFFVSKKLDPITAREWELHQISGEIPTMDDFQVFLKQRCDLLETLSVNQSPRNIGAGTKIVKVAARQSNNTFLASDYNCALCKGSHSIYTCSDFLKLSIADRIAEIKHLKLCINCMKDTHFCKDCKGRKCKKCGKKHNTLLHLESNASTSAPVAAEELSPNTELNLNLNLTQGSFSQQTSQAVLLSTAIVQVFDKFGKLHNCRAILDSGAQSNFVASKMCDLLKLQKTNVHMTILDINQISSDIQHSVRIKIKSRLNSYHATLSCLVVPKISEALPASPLCKLNIPQNINLADPNFDKVGGVDKLIGAGIFWDLICMGQFKLGRDQPVLQKTSLGWIVSGPILNLQHQSQSTHCGFSAEVLQDQLAKFWELEEPPKQRILSNEEIACEEHFVETTKRNSAGRFIVRIPLKESISKLGDSQQIAVRRFNALERKLQANEILRVPYVAFMTEYENMGHMSLVNDHFESSTSYYLPHHGVLKEDSLTTKLRVVFDGSTKSTSGISLNDLQMVGPVIQDDLLSISMRFRKHAVAISADISKMYRQVLVSPDQTCLQRIVWRNHPSEPLRHYNLNTVTYGTASASYLAIRALHEIARINSVQYPRTSQIILQDFYVDDLLSGASTTEEATIICDELASILSAGGFELRKWSSNKPEVLQNVDTDDLVTVLQIGSDESTKTLGLYWFPKADIVKYCIKPTVKSNNITKRTILSTVAQIYDPLGLLAPCVVLAKIMLQTLWQYRLSWDESVPLGLHTQWSVFRGELMHLNQIEIPRQVICNNVKTIELHGFSDASEAAYGACIYLRSIDNSDQVTVRLLCAKTRVAPLKTVSMPRLELCGALLLAQLSKKVISSMHIDFEQVSYWCDSTIVLAWTKTPSHLLKAFVANRITEIRNLTDPDRWLHVGTNDNPADLLTRGINPADLLDCQKWWQGPSWLSQHIDQWPTDKNEKFDTILPELRPQTVMLCNDVPTLSLFDRYSHFNKLQRVTAYCLRFIDNSRKAKQLRKLGQLSTIELNNSVKYLVRIAQSQVLSREIKDLTNGKGVGSSSPLLALNPFIDKEGIIRVGGRLIQSSFSMNTIHPIVLPKGHQLTKLIAQHEHVRILHAGPQALLASLRQQYWPIHGRSLVKGITRGCVKCFRSNPMPTTRLMGELPATRLTPTPPFYNSGVDYAGPFMIKESTGRSSRRVKSYVCLFICFASKAIHLELVPDLTTEAFLGAFRRFAARRGKPANMYSDNGTTFVGANSELVKLGQFLQNNTNQLELTNSLATDGIMWHFIPPRSPHFGGIWEAGVKSMKYHLTRVIGDASLTFIEFYTVLSQVEAVLNSRPLSPLSTDPNDLNPITPAHLLIGRPLTSLPDPNVMDLPQNRLSRYQRIQQMTQNFWKRWSKEYVSELQQRTKWKRNSNIQLKTGSMVVIKDDNLPPLKWQIGRVTELHQGPDGICRVVTIRTATNVLKRAVVKICALPIENDN